MHFCQGAAYLGVYLCAKVRCFSSGEFVLVVKNVSLSLIVFNLQTWQHGGILVAIVLRRLCMMDASGLALCHIIYLLYHILYI